MANIQERLMYKPGDINWNACTYCANYLEDEKCKAFPDGIPNKILAGKNNHLEPVEGDHGILFTPKPDWEIPARLQRQSTEGTVEKNNGS